MTEYNITEFTRSNLTLIRKEIESALASVDYAKKLLAAL